MLLFLTTGFNKKLHSMLNNPESWVPSYLLENTETNSVKLVWVSPYQEKRMVKLRDKKGRVTGKEERKFRAGIFLLLGNEKDVLEAGDQLRTPLLKAGVAVAFDRKNIKIDDWSKYFAQNEPIIKRWAREIINLNWAEGFLSEDAWKDSLTYYERKKLEDEKEKASRNLVDLEELDSIIHKGKGNASSEAKEEVKELVKETAKAIASSTPSAPEVALEPEPTSLSLSLVTEKLAEELETPAEEDDSSYGSIPYWNQWGQGSFFPV